MSNGPSLTRVGHRGPTRRVVLARGFGLAGCALSAGLLSGCQPSWQWISPSAHRATIGVLSPSPDNPSGLVWQKLSARGWIRGDNLIVEYREGNLGTYAELAAELVHLGVDLIISDAEPPAKAAKGATSSIPILMLVSDAISSGLVSSLARPAGNITGISTLGPETSSKQLDLLRELSPSLSKVAVMWHPAIIDSFREYTRIVATARASNIEIFSATAGLADQVPWALERIRESNADGLIVLNLVLYTVDRTVRSSILGLAANQRIPAIYGTGYWVRAGGLMSYSLQVEALAEREAAYVDKILRGARPADLPVEQPTAFELALNTRTAQALGLSIPSSLASQVTQWVE